VAAGGIEEIRTPLSISRQLGDVRLAPLGPNGRIAGDPVLFSSLWSQRGAVVLAVRRPG
jgi:hypothetical protein